MITPAEDLFCEPVTTHPISLLCNWSRWLSPGDMMHTGWGVIPMDSDAGEEFEYVLHKDGNVSFKSINI
mgnify:CR=1 FL=1